MNKFCTKCLRFLRNIVAVLSLVAISTLPQEADARTQKKSASTSKLKKRSQTLNKKAEKKPRKVKKVRAPKKAAKKVKQKRAPKKAAKKVKQKRAPKKPVQVNKKNKKVKKVNAADLAKAEQLRQKELAALAQKAEADRRAAEQRLAQLRQENEENARRAEEQRLAQLHQENEAKEVFVAQRANAPEKTPQELELGESMGELHGHLIPQFFEYREQVLEKPFEKQELIRLANSGAQVNFIGVDIGYPEGERSRTQQYGEAGMNFPTAPLFHPYHPANNTIEFSAPAFTLNIKSPFYILHAPEALLHNLVGNAPENIEGYFTVQDMPWLGVPLQLKPHYWRFPNTPNVLRDPSDTQKFTARVGVFSKKIPNIRIQGQPENGLLEEKNLSVHPGEGNRMISSSNVLSLENLDLYRSQVLYSLTKYRNEENIEKAAVGKHLLLNREDQKKFEELLNVSTDLQDLKRNMHTAKIGGGFHFHDFDLDEAF